jgi:hypothetical protein
LRNHRAPSADISNAYRRAAELGEQYLRFIAERPAPGTDASDAQFLVSTAYAHLQEGDKAVAAARQASEAQPFNPMSYRAMAAALLRTQQGDEAAVELMTGFMVTGNRELRSALIDLYRSGLDKQSCATTTKTSGVVLNTSCEIVRRHLCAAAARANELQKRAGHPELAAQVAESTRGVDCGNVGTP